MTPWKNERWATMPANDGRNFAPAHRWELAESKPWCFGSVKGHQENSLCSECKIYFLCALDRGDNKRYKKDDDLAVCGHALRSYIREAREHHARIATLEAALQRQVENVERWIATGIPADAEESRPIYEQMVCALRGKLPRCPDCGHRLDTEECGCARGDA